MTLRGGDMKKIGVFLTVGFAFAALQLSTVSAQTGMPPMGNQGMPPMGNQGMPPMGNQGMPPMGDMDCVNAGNPTEVAACWDAKAHAKGAPGMPPMGSMPPGTAGMPPMGSMPPGTAGMPPMGSMPPGTAGMPPMGSMPPGTAGMPPMGSMPPGTAGMPPMGSMPPGTAGMPPMDMNPAAIQERCKGAPTAALRADCVANNNRNRHDGPRGKHRMGKPGMPHKMENRDRRQDRKMENRDRRQDRKMENRDRRQDRKMENRDRRQDRKMGNQGMPPMGSMPPGTAGMPQMGKIALPSDVCMNVKAKNEKKRMRKQVKCLRGELHAQKPTVKLRQTKDGLGAYGCGVKKTGSKQAQIGCLSGLLDAPQGQGMPSMQGEHRDGPRDLMANKGPRRGGKMGNYGCGNKNRKKHVNCLRDLLDTTPLSAQVKHAKKGKKRGFYGCNGLRDGKWKKHVNCLRRLLDQHGPQLAKGGGGKRGMAPGTR
jgi:hypothetical protein